MKLWVKKDIWQDSAITFYFYKLSEIYKNFYILLFCISGFALDSTSISCSINLLVWAEGKYSRGAVKMHTLIDLRGSPPTFILITDGKYHNSNALDEIIPVQNAIYIDVIRWGQSSFDYQKKGF